MKLIRTWFLWLEATVKIPCGLCYAVPFGQPTQWPSSSSHRLLLPGQRVISAFLLQMAATVGTKVGISGTTRYQSRKDCIQTATRRDEKWIRVKDGKARNIQSTKRTIWDKLYFTSKQRAVVSSSHTFLKYASNYRILRIRPSSACSGLPE